MTERFYPPFQRFFTSDLKTLPGALLYFYENGTATPKVVYQDPFKTTPHENPVETIDGAGNFPAIFIDGTYTVELKNSAGVTQPGWPVDNVGGEQVEGAFDDYSAITSYQIGDIVTGSNGLFYISQQNNNLNNDPTIPANIPAWWKVLSLTNNYDPLAQYFAGEWVISSGEWFRCKADSLGNNPSSSSSFWDLAKNTFVWNSTTTYASGTHVFVGNDVYVSQQAANLSHNPVGDSGAWWLPVSRVYVNEQPQLFKANVISGGATLKAEWNNILTDGNSGYLLPLANSVPANTQLMISKSDIARVLYPIITRSGSDTIRWLGGIDTSFQIDTQFADSMILYSNGTNQWSF